MGKIRIKTLGIEEIEKEEKKKARLAHEAKQAKKRQEQEKMVKAPGLKGGEKVAAVGPSEEEIEAQLKTDAIDAKKAEESPAKEKAKKKSKFAKKKARSRKYQAVAALVDKNKIYSLAEALVLLPKLKLANFDETVELHINTKEAGINGNIDLPHGTGRKIRVVVADDKIIDAVSKGKIDFDVLLASPNIMPKLAKVAKFLGPKGLMPNPKNGTITEKPDEAIRKFEAGQVRFKTETKIPVMHLAVGKLSFGEKKLSENIKTALSVIGQQNINNVTLKSTMSPGIKIDLTK